MLLKALDMRGTTLPREAFIRMFRNLYAFRKRSLSRKIRADSAG